MLSPAPAVAVRRVGVRYGPRLALADATAEVAPGSLVCLVGLNGAGKSTLLRAILGVVPHSGEVSVLGVRDGRRRSLLAYVPQREDVNWQFPITAQEVVLLGGRGALRRVGPTAGADRAAALEALERVGLAGARRRPIGELSGGQQQRVVIARALFARAPVMLLDEPLAGVDPTSARVILDLLREVCAAGGTVLMATHDVSGSARFADRAWGLNRTVVADVPAARLCDEDVLRRIYGESLLVLEGGRLAIGDQAR